ncbi:amidohydrolase family protein [Elioraea tepida]|uniref:Amidohydrolase family protein n=1 Tax=Elioraea tepida TaxID=2843330 RepID=A0A975YJ69_9PROT|nr:amidohydrolase family protein [Elioraea tepida]QXM24142.1 amidohydrolase family protein [Elioraea tepida]
MTPDPHRPLLVCPQGSIECHSHVYDPVRFPYVLQELGETPHDWQAFRDMLDRLGFDRAAIVQAAAYGTDNRCTLDAVERLGRGRARAVVVTGPDETEAGFRALHAQGARALRVFLGTPFLSLADIKPLAKRIAPLGWHIILQDPAGPNIAAWAEAIEGIPCPVVIDHLGRIPPGPGAMASATHPQFQALLRLVETGRVYVKLSGFYYSSATGWPYQDVEPRVRALVELRPDRLLYGANWPHPKLQPKPDDAKELDLLLDWVPDAGTREMILRDNPARLYFSD